MCEAEAQIGLHDLPARRRDECRHLEAIALELPRYPVRDEAALTVRHHHRIRIDDQTVRPVEGSRPYGHRSAKAHRGEWWIVAVRRSRWWRDVFGGHLQALVIEVEPNPPGEGLLKLDQTPIPGAPDRGARRVATPENGSSRSSSQSGSFKTSTRKAPSRSKVTTTCVRSSSCVEASGSRLSTAVRANPESRIARRALTS